MTTVTIPEKLTKREDLVLIPKREYEEFLRLRRFIRIVQPTQSERRAIVRGKLEVKRGSVVSWNDVKHGLARRSR